MTAPTKPKALLLGLIVSLLAAGALLSRGTAQTGSPAKSDDKTKRLVYVVKYGSAKDAAAVLTKHFKGEVEAQDAGSNVLLVSANATVFEELLATLAQLDRKPAVIAVEITLLEVPSRKGEPADKDFDDKELTGPADAVANNLKALQKRGVVGSVQRFQVTILENQMADVLQGETKPQVTSVVKKAGGPSAFAVKYTNVGTHVQATPRLGPDKTIQLDLRLDESRMIHPEDGIVLGMDDKGLPIIMAEIVTAKFAGKCNVTSGQTVLLQGVETSSKSGKTRTLVIVSALVVQ